MTETISWERKKSLVIHAIEEHVLNISALVEDLYIHIILSSGSCMRQKITIYVDKIGVEPNIQIQCYCIDDVVKTFNFYDVNLEDSLVKELNNFYNKWSGKDETVTISLHTIGGLCEE